MIRFLSILLLSIVSLVAQGNRTVMVSTNTGVLNAGTFATGVFPNITQFATDEQDISSQDPRLGRFLISLTQPVSGFWVWDNASTDPSGDGVIEASGYVTGRWVRQFGGTTAPDLDSSKGVVIDSSKRIVASTATKQQIDKAAMQVATVADMVGLSTNLNNGQLIQTGGYWTNGDGGGATYRWDSSSSAATNTGSVIALTSGGAGRFLLVAGDSVNVMQWGAKSYPAWSPQGYATAGTGFAGPATGDFSIAVQTDWPSSAYVTARPAGTHLGICRLVTTNATASAFDLWKLASDIEVVVDSSYLYVTFRSTGGSSSAASGAGIYQIPFSNLSALWGTTDGTLVITRSGSTIAAYFNGTALTGGTYQNQVRFADSVNDGFDARLDLGASNGNSENYFSNNVRRGRVFERVLTGGDLSDPWSAGTVASHVDRYWTSTAPEDSSSKIQAALTYAYTNNVKTVVLNGRFRSDAAISIPPRVAFVGLGSAAGSSFGKFDLQTAVSAVGPSSLFKWYDSTNHIVRFNGYDYPDLIYQSAITLRGETFNSYQSGSTVAHMTVDGNLGYLGSGFDMAYVANTAIDDVSFVGVPGATLNQYYVTRSKFSKLTGVVKRGIAHAIGADCEYRSMDLGGGAGSLLGLYSVAACPVYDNLFWNSSADTRYVVTSSAVSTNTGYITVSQNRYSSGDIVMLSGTVPTGMSATEFYFAYRVSSTQLGLATNRANALAGVVVIPTTATSGFTVGPGRVRNIFYNGGTAVLAWNNRSEEGYEHNIEVLNANRGFLSGNAVYRPGWTNPTNTWAGVFVESSGNISIENTMSGTRTSSSDGASLYGVFISTNNTSIRVGAVAGQVNTPFAVDPAQSTAEVSGPTRSAAYSDNNVVKGIVIRTDNTIGAVNESVGSTAARWRFRHSANTRQYPLPVTANMTLGVISADGLYQTNSIDYSLPWDRSGVLNNFALEKASIQFYAGENWSSTANGSYILLKATPYGTTSPTDVIGFYPYAVQPLVSFQPQAGLRVGASSSGSTITRIRRGRVSLTAGAATVSDSNVTTSSDIQLTSNADGGTPGWLRVSARSAGVSFTITSSSGTDTSSVGWIMVEP